jgi:protein-S-isoprenylcysteine O-methyltransferase Ste14
MMIPVLIARMNSEERLLQSQFGQQYDDYRSRTSRLIAGIY